MSIFKACDIRGVYGEEWRAAEARRIGCALGHMMARRGETHICVGGDFRRSTPEIKQALIDGLAHCGAAVRDVGQLPTPVVYFAAARLDYANVAIVTASHNPGKYNGIKFMIAGRPAVPTVIDELQAAMGYDSASPSQGTVDQHEIGAAYEKWVIGHASDLLAALKHRHGAATRPPRIVLDAMGGAYTHMGPRVLAAAGYDVSSVGGEIDPDFAARTPNPASDANLASLVQQVLQAGASAGVALDGDGDRVIFVDDRGRIVRPEQIAALLLRHCFRASIVIFDLKCASLVPRTVTAAGGTPIMQPSGHGFIKAAMIERKADLGVEVSGHHFFGALGGGDDGLFTALVVLGLLARTGQSLSELIEPFAWPMITPDLRIPYDGDAAAAVDRIARHCGGEVSRLDGVRAEYEDGWALARASITEPAITLRFEGTDKRQLVAIVHEFLAGTAQLRCQVLELIDVLDDPK